MGCGIGSSEFTNADKRLIAVTLHYGLSINALNDHGENLFLQIVKNILMPSELSKLDLLLYVYNYFINRQLIIFKKHVFKKTKETKETKEQKEKKIDS